MTILSQDIWASSEAMRMVIGCIKAYKFDSGKNYALK